MEHPLVGGAVPEEGDGHVVPPELLVPEGGAGADGDPPADDAVGADDAKAEVDDVHRPALTPAVAVDAAKQLRHHPVHLRTLGDQMAVPAVRRRDAVVRTQRRAHAGRDGLLADVEMHEPGKLTALEQRRELLLEAADPQHRAMHLQAFLDGVPHVEPPL